MSNAVLASDSCCASKQEKKVTKNSSMVERFKAWWSYTQAVWRKRYETTAVETKVESVKANPAPSKGLEVTVTDDNKTLVLYDSPDAKASRRRIMLLGWGTILISLALIIFITTLVWQYVQGPSGDKPVASTTANSFIPVEGRDPRFIQEDVGVGELNRVIGKGLVGDNADEYAKSLLENAGHSAAALAVYAYESGLWDNPNDTESLLTPDKTYLSDEGIGLWHALRGAIEAKSTTRSVAEAPANGYNTGFADDKYGSANVAGIRGDRTAVYITFKDGSVLIVMRRCGNPVHPSRPNLPVVPTDNPRLTPKNASQDPAARGNAPVGGGTNLDPGPGRYVPPSQMEEPPVTIRINPPAPAPIEVPMASTPDSTPAPTPEVGAPTPSAPATGYSRPPGL